MNPRTRRPRGGLSERVINSVPRSALAPLSRRQADVLGWIAAGKRNGEKHVLIISPGTLFPPSSQTLLDSALNFVEPLLEFAQRNLQDLPDNF